MSDVVPVELDIEPPIFCNDGRYQIIDGATGSIAEGGEYSVDIDQLRNWIMKG